MSARGPPCTNCTLDEKQCRLPNDAILRNRAAYVGRELRHGSGSGTFNADDGMPSPGSQIWMTNTPNPQGQVQLTGTEDPWQKYCLDSLDFHDVANASFLENARFSLPTSYGQHALKSPIDQQPLSSSSFLLPNSATVQMPVPITGDVLSSRESTVSTPSTFGSRTKGLVMYSYYQFLTIGNIHTVPPEDVNYLESQGCFHVPNPVFLDIFLRSYFMHVHLFLPLIDEGDFWDMQSDSPTTSDRPKATASLLLLRAMLFAACNFVPFPVLQELGYHDASTARADLYRKSKLLFDLELESDHLPRAQSALLLMGWVPNSTTTSHPSPNPFRMWLSRALHHAKHINAHRHRGIDEEATWTHSTERPSAATLRRLWWCCIILDRISPLCARFQLQITSDLLDTDTSVPLGFRDLQGEIYRSKVFVPATKRRLIGIFTKLMDLLMLLTDVLPIAFPFEARPNTDSGLRENEQSKILHCLKKLANWYEAANTEFPVFHGSQAREYASVDDPAKCTILYTNLMYVYYHTSCLMLCNCVIFSQISHQATGNSEICYKTVRHVFGITECVRALTQHNLITYLPVTVLACLATPLALYITTARLSLVDDNADLTDPDTQSVIDLGSNQSQLHVLMQAVDGFYHEHKVSQWIKETARYASNLAQSYNQDLSHSGEEALRDWVHMLMTHPSKYLRLTWTVDLCISRASLPESHDFPNVFAAIV